MSVVTLTFYEYDDPPVGGTPVGSLTDADLEHFALRKVISTKGVHSAEVIVNRHDAAAALLVQGRWMTVTIPIIDADPIVAVRLGPRFETVLSEDEEAGEVVQIGGLGVLSQLQHARLLEEFYAPGQPCRGSCPSRPGEWSWLEGAGIAYGGIMVRGIEEGQGQPGAPLEHITITFDREDNSAGTAWPHITEEFRQSIGVDIGTLHDRIAEGGRLFLREHADLTVDGFSAYGQGTFGVDRTASTFATGKVLFSVDPDVFSNLLTGLEEEGGDEPYTHVIVEGANGVYVTRTSPAYSSGPGKWGFVNYNDSDDTTLLEDVGDEFLARSGLRTQAREFEIAPGDDELNGLYLPVKHFNEGDLASLDAAGIEEDVRIVAWRLELASAVSDASDADAARSLHIVVETDAVNSEDGGEPGGIGAAGGPGICCGPRAPAPGTAGTAPVVVSAAGTIGDLGGAASVLLDISSDEAGAAIYAAVIDTAGGTLAAQWQHNASDPGSRESMTLIDSNTVGSVRVSLYRLLNPTPTTSGLSFVRFTDSAAQERFVAYWYLTGVDQSDPDDAAVFSSGLGVTSSIGLGAGSSDLALNAAGWWANNQSGMANPTAGGGQTSDFASFVTRPPGQPDGEGGAGHGANNPTWTWSGAKTWLAGGIVVHSADPGTTGDTTEPIGEDGEEAPGTSDIFAPLDHVHEHGSLTESNDYHDADQISIDDAGAYFGSSTVEGALQELGAGITGDFLTPSDGEGHTVNTVAASGSTETLDLADGNLHDVTLTDDCEFTFAGATNGVGCVLQLQVRQPSSGGPYTVTWPASVLWPGGVAPTLSTDADALDAFTFRTIDGGTTWIADHFGGTSAGIEAADLVALGVVGPILIADDHSTPLVFADLIQTEAGDDLLYGDIGE